MTAHFWKEENEEGFRDQVGGFTPAERAPSLGYNRAYGARRLPGWMVISSISASSHVNQGGWAVWAHRPLGCESVPFNWLRFTELDFGVTRSLTVSLSILPIRPSRQAANSHSEPRQLGRAGRGERHPAKRGASALGSPLGCCPHHPST